MHILASHLVLKAVLALHQAGSLSQSELADSVGAGVSSTQKTLRLLTEDGVVGVTMVGKRRRYGLTERSLVGPLLDLATAAVTPREALEVAARANHAVEFVATSDRDLVVVFAAAAIVGDESRAARLLQHTAELLDLTPRFMDHDDVRRELLADNRLRLRMASADIVYGDLDRSFPDRSRHRRAPAVVLGQPHASLRLPSRRALRRIATQHGVDSMRLFGSAVRSDFRPDSDVDVLVRFGSGDHPRLESLRNLEHELERITGRDVDLLREEAIGPNLARKVEAEAVALL